MNNEIYSIDEITEKAFRYFRDNGFPYRKLPIHVCMQEINVLANTPDEKLMKTNRGYHIADTYHPHRFHAKAINMDSPYDAFMNDKKLKKSYKEYAYLW